MNDVTISDTERFMAALINNPKLQQQTINVLRMIADNEIDSIDWDIIESAQDLCAELGI